MSTISSNLASPARIVADPTEQKIRKEIQKAKINEKVKEIREKSPEDRTVGDYVTIGNKVINDVITAPTVLHANPNKLNYMA